MTGRAERITVCSDGGRHKERTLRHLLLDPVTPPTRMLFGIVVAPSIGSGAV